MMMADYSEKKKKKKQQQQHQSLDPQLWHACAGGMVQMPPVNSAVYYFPQGHAEHSQTHVDFTTSSVRIPDRIFCRVGSINYLADSETDEVFARLRLIPCHPETTTTTDDDDDAFVTSNSAAAEKKPCSFAKTLTQSDANNGGGFSVPRYCAETIFPRLDYSADPPVQTVVAKDVHGELWKFRHIYRGTPRRHLLTTGWSTFVNHKKLVAGDSIVFLRAENGDLRVGIRRAKRGFPLESGWNSGFAARSGGKVRAESVVEAAIAAANGQGFEVAYYPRASTPEFCVKAAAVRAAQRVQWYRGMRFKMAFETEDSSRISWFLGTIASLQANDPIRWPNSLWRALQVTWDEPELLQNVKCVSPWLIELVSNFPIINIAPFSPPRKKLCLPQHSDFPFDEQLTLPSFSGNPLGSSSPMCYPPENTSAGIQGARHAQLRISLSNLHYNNKLQLGLLSSSFQRFDQNSKIPNGIRNGHTNSNENLSCLLTMGNSNHNLEKSDNAKKHQFVLFGQPILTEQQISRSCSSDTVPQLPSGKNVNNENAGRKRILSVGSDSALERWGSLEKSSFTNQFHTLDLETGHCKVFMESEDVGRTLDLSLLGSYEELYRRLAIMFGQEKPEMLSHVLYRDGTGAVKQTGDEPFSYFKRTTKRLTIITHPANQNFGRTWIRGMETADNALGASNKTGPLSIFV